jgi:hypothetical protein
MTEGGKSMGDVAAFLMGSIGMVAVFAFALAGWVAMRRG